MNHERTKPKNAADSQVGSAKAGLTRVLHNASWITADRILRLVLGLLVTSLLARHLGPSDFGILQIAIVMVHLLGAVGGLGLQHVVNRELIDHPEQSNTLLGSTALLLLFGGIGSLALAALGTWLVPIENPQFSGVVLLIALTLPFSALLSFRFWFESKVFSKPIVIVESAATGLVHLIRLFLIYISAGLMAFASAVFIQYLLISVGVWIVFTRYYTNWRKLSIDYAVARRLLHQSWPLLISGLTAITLTRIDLFMIGIFLDASEAGTYAAATRISEVWHFFPAAIIASSFPILLKIRHTDRQSYNSKLTLLFKTTTYLALVVAVATSFLASPIIQVLFGESYGKAAPILAAHIWGGVFVALSISTAHWLTGEHLQKLELLRTATAAIANIILNLWLIPAHGAIGAAYATIFTLFWLGIGFDLLHPATRTLFKLKMHALLFCRLTQLDKLKKKTTDH